MQTLTSMVHSIKSRGFLRDARVAEALMAIDRSHFVPPERKGESYKDSPLLIGHGQTISAPSVVAFMLEHLDLKEGMRVLEIGTGSGYNAALISYLLGPTGTLVSVEIVPEVHQIAKDNIRKVVGLLPNNYKLILGDGFFGYPECAPYDRIIVTAAIPSFGAVPALLVQLKEDGKIIAPIEQGDTQDLILYDSKQGLRISLLSVMFVPLTGKGGAQK